MADDGIAADEIARQIAALRGRVAQHGVMAYLDTSGSRKDVNKLFLNNTIRSVDSHNRRQEEEKCWKIRELEERLDSRSDRGRGRDGSRRRDRRSRSPERDRDRRRRRRSRSRSRGRDERRSRRDRNATSHDRRRHDPDASERRSPPSQHTETTSERDYWARKKAEKTNKMWENLHARGSVSVENAPAFGSDDDSSESSDDDVKPPPPSSSSSSAKRRKRRRTEDD